MECSEIMLALRAPTTTGCDMCLVPFCGINVQGRCVAAPLLAQQPHDLGKLDDLIESPRFFGCFDENTVEVNFLIDYMTAQDLTPKHIYREVRLNEG
jgi:E3 ubiquitin-protein ligase CHFR